MKTNEHEKFLQFVKEEDGIFEASRISGDGCYLLKFGVKTQEELNLLLNNLLVFGNYRLSIIVGDIKA
jgi:Lrp/AsnC family leucine-responsive transcriptional regulator